MRRLLPVYICINLPVLFFLPSVFWDDWVLFNTQPEYIYQRFDQAGSFLNWVAYYHHFMMGQLGPWSYKLLTATVFTINGWLFTRVLNIYQVSKLHQWLFALVYLIVPMFTSRYVAINTPYLIGPLLFLLGWLVMSRNLVVSAILFFLSFSIQSLLVVYAIPFMLYAYGKYKSKTILPNLPRLSIMALLPFIFIAIKIAYFKPHGYYEGYTTISLANVIPSLLRVPEVTYIILHKAILSYNVFDYLAFIIFWATSYFGLSKVLTFWVENKVDIQFAAGNATIWIAITGCLLSIIPYALVGNELNFYYAFESRNQSVLIFPISLVGAHAFHYFIIKFNRAGRVTSLFVLSLMVVLQILIYQGYANDWSKTVKIINALKVSDLSLSHNIVVKDQIFVPFAENRKLSHYEWAGLMRYSTLRNGFYARDEEYWNGKACYKGFRESPLYNSQEYGIRSNNNVTRITLNSLNGFRLPLLGYVGYTVVATVDPTIQWCHELCGMCGYE